MAKVIIILGKTGSGKSTLANVISGTSKFKESKGSVSETKEIQKEEFIDNNINYAVIDTVGIGDTKLKKEEVLDKIAEAVYLAKDGVSQILFVTSGRFDQFEMSTYNLLRTIIFDNDATNYTTIVRTKFDDFEDEEECQTDIEKMLKEQELSEIVSSCQKRIVHINNSSLSSKYGQEEREGSRRIVLEHLQNLQGSSEQGSSEQGSCSEQEEIYIPEKLKRLSSEIANYMKKKIESKMKLAEKEEEKRKKLEKAKQAEEEIKKTIEKSSTVEDNKNKSENFSIKIVSHDKEESAEIIEKDSLQTVNNQNLESNKKVFIKLRISSLENQIKELEETKKLIEEIQKNDGLIRQKVFSHIFNNINDIAKVTGGDTFINSIVSDNDNPYASKLSFAELEKQRKELEAKLLEQKDNDKSLDEIKDEITQKEQSLLNLKKELLTIKEVFEEWQKQGFNVQQTNEWADALGSNFNPETDASFCAWLRDNKKIVVEKKLDDQEIEQLRIEYDPQQSNKSKDTKTILLIGRSGRGKSTLANVITGTNKFKESSGRVSETKKIQFEEFTDAESGTNYLVIDTPGIGDTKMSDNEVLDIIAEAVYRAKDGISQVFFVIDGRFDQYEMATYDLLRTIIFDDNITKHTTIARTRFDNFTKPKKCKADTDLMVKEAKEKKSELEKKVNTKEEELKNLTSENVEYKELLAEIEKAKKELTATNLAEIIESCQEKVVYVDNSPIEIAGADEEELQANKRKREKSRVKLLEHLSKVCQEVPYKPEKLKELSYEIVDYMDKFLQSRKKLEAEMKKIKTGSVSSTNRVSIKLTTTKESLIKELRKEYAEYLEKEVKILDKHYNQQLNLEEIPKFATEGYDSINIATGKIKELEDKKAQLQKEIQEKEKIIRQKVLKHIFNNYQEISNELGGDILAQSVVGEHNWENISPEFKDKELVLKWLNNKFDYEQIQKWAIALGNGFDPKVDADFCTWLRDEKQLTAEKIQELDYSENNGDRITQIQIPPKNN